MRRGTERVLRSEYISGLSLSEIFSFDAVMPRFLVQMTCAHCNYAIMIPKEIDHLSRSKLLVDDNCTSWSSDLRSVKVLVLHAVICDLIV